LAGVADLSSVVCSASFITPISVSTTLWSSRLMTAKGSTEDEDNAAAALSMMEACDRPPVIGAAAAAAICSSSAIGGCPISSSESDLTALRAFLRVCAEEDNGTRLLRIGSARPPSDAASASPSSSSESGSELGTSRVRLPEAECWTLTAVALGGLPRRRGADAEAAAAVGELWPLVS
jgi:hypothetical protein